MTDETDMGRDGVLSLNDNRSPDGKPAVTSQEKLDRVVLSIARLIGRRIAREHFEARHAANDNRVVVSGREEGSRRKSESPGDDEAG